MCRWFSFFLLPYIVYLISAEEQNAKNSLLNRAVHPRRHKRAERVPATPANPSPFMSMNADPICMTEGRPMMSCPKKNPNNDTEPVKCIEMREICDDTPDCYRGEDEDPHFCMFKKLEDAEMMRLKGEIRVLAQNNQRKQPEFLDVVVNNQAAKERTKIPEIPGRPGVFKLKAGSGPLAKIGVKAPTFQEPEYESGEDDDSEEEEEQQREAARRHRRRRAYRHLLGLDTASL